MVKESHELMLEMVKELHEPMLEVPQVYVFTGTNAFRHGKYKKACHLEYPDLEVSIRSDSVGNIF